MAKKRLKRSTPKSNTKPQRSKFDPHGLTTPIKSKDTKIKNKAPTKVKKRLGQGGFFSDPSNISQLSGIAAPLLNMAVPGLGTAVGIGGNAIAGIQGAMQQKEAEEKRRLEQERLTAQAEQIQDDSLLSMYPVQGRKGVSFPFGGNIPYAKKPQLAQGAQLSSDAQLATGNPQGHGFPGGDVEVEQGGQVQALVEPGEVVTDEGQVFSERSGHANIVEGVEKAKGFIEKFLANPNLKSKDKFEHNTINRLTQSLAQAVNELDTTSELIFLDQEQRKNGGIAQGGVPPVEQGIGQQFPDGGRLPYNFEEYKQRFGLQETEDYDLRKAHEIGLIPDATGHLSSVDPETGIFLKSKTHPTVGKEIAYGQTLNDQTIINREDGRLQYVPNESINKGKTKTSNNLQAIPRKPNGGRIPYPHSGVVTGGGFSASKFAGGIDNIVSGPKGFEDDPNFEGFNPNQLRKLEQRQSNENVQNYLYNRDNLDIGGFKLNLDELQNIQKNSTLRSDGDTDLIRKFNKKREFARGGRIDNPLLPSGINMDYLRQHNVNGNRSLPNNLNANIDYRLPDNLGSPAMLNYTSQYNTGNIDRNSNVPGTNISSNGNKSNRVDVNNPPIISDDVPVEGRTLTLGNNNLSKLKSKDLSQLSNTPLTAPNIQGVNTNPITGGNNLGGLGDSLKNFDFEKLGNIAQGVTPFLDNITAAIVNQTQPELPKPLLEDAIQLDRYVDTTAQQQEIANARGANRRLGQNLASSNSAAAINQAANAQAVSQSNQLFSEADKERRATGNQQIGINAGVTQRNLQKRNDFADSTFFQEVKRKDNITENISNVVEDIRQNELDNNLEERDQKLQHLYTLAIGDTAASASMALAGHMDDFKPEWKQNYYDNLLSLGRIQDAEQLSQREAWSEVNTAGLEAAKTSNANKTSTTPVTSANSNRLGSLTGNAFNLNLSEVPSLGRGFN